MRESIPSLGCCSWSGSGRGANLICLAKSLEDIEEVEEITRSRGD